MIMKAHLCKLAHVGEALRRLALATVVVAIGFGFSGFAVAARMNWHLWLSSGGPSPRGGFAMTYDRSQQVTVIFGGTVSGGVQLHDTWVWNGNSWTNMSSSPSPTGREGAMMAYDEARGEVVLFGGYDDRGRIVNDTWVWNGSGWTQQFPSTSPPARSFGGMAYDAARGQVVLFGGSSDTGAYADTWVWDGSSWSSRSSSDRPTARGAVSMTYDRARGQVVLFGGRQYDGVYLNDTWSWNGSRWARLTPATTPSPRSTAAVAFEEARGEVVMFGGYSGDYLGDTWVFDGADWSQPALGGSPSRRTSAQMAYDPRWGEIVLFGGWNGTLLDDTWAYQVAPVIRGQPASQVVPPGGTATLSVDAAGTQYMSFQWFEGVANDMTRPVAGATSSSLTTPPLSSSTSYWVRVSNLVSNSDSDTAYVTVSTGGCYPPSIIVQPQDQVVPPGSSTVVYVGASGSDPLGYQWYEGASGDRSYPISGATSWAYTTPAMSSTTSFWVRVINACGSFDSNAATVTVTGGIGPVISSINPSRARRGSTISIYGSGFSATRSGNTAYVGGRRARVTSASSTRLRVKVPRNAPRGSVGVYVIVGGVSSNVALLTVM